MQTVRLSQVPAQPWRNGGGTTQELLAWPDPHAWRLRLSVARIDRSGPFSAYPGVMRDFAVLQGRGVRLTWGERATVLTPDSEVLAFDGGAPPGCELIDGATVDLNLMVQQGAGTGGLLRVQAGQIWSSKARWRGVYTATAATLHLPGERLLPLAADTLVWNAEARPQPWALTPVTDTLRAWWVHFEDRTSGSAAP
jgi:environmental stress-induced protein Ves